MITPEEILNCYHNALKDLNFPPKKKKKKSIRTPNEQLNYYHYILRFVFQFQWEFQTISCTVITICLPATTSSPGILSNIYSSTFSLAQCTFLLSFFPKATGVSGHRGSGLRAASRYMLPRTPSLSQGQEVVEVWGEWVLVGLWVCRILWIIKEMHLFSLWK